MKGQTCYICTQALHWKTKEGLVRGCACRGTAGFAHVSCLAEQAKILVAEVEENNLGDEVLQARFLRWSECSLCKQQYHGVLRCALGWACWKTFVGRPEKDWVHASAMCGLANGLSEANLHEAALSVEEVRLSMLRRIGASEERVLISQGNLANTYEKLRRYETALQMKRDVYSGSLRLNGPVHKSTLIRALNLSTSLVDSGKFAEARAFMPDQMKLAKRVLGFDHIVTLDFQWGYSRAFINDEDVSARELAEVVLPILGKAQETSQQVFGGKHPRTCNISQALTVTRKEIVRRGLA